MFTLGQEVMIYNLDNTGKEYKAKIAGLAINWGTSPASIYIVELLETIDPEYWYSHCTMPASCLKLA